MYVCIIPRLHVTIVCNITPFNRRDSQLIKPAWWALVERSTSQIHHVRGCRRPKWQNISRDCPKLPKSARAIFNSFGQSHATLILANETPIAQNYPKPQFKTAQEVLCSFGWSRASFGRICRHPLNPFNAVATRTDFLVRGVVRRPRAFRIL